MSTSQTINELQHYLPATGDAEWGGILTSYLHGLSYAKRALLVFGAASGLSNGVEVFAVPGYAAASSVSVSLPAPFTGKIRGVYARCRTVLVPSPAPATAQVTVQVYVNGGDNDGTAIIGNSATTGSATINLAVVAGDLITVGLLASSYSSGGADMLVSLVLVAA